MCRADPGVERESVWTLQLANQGGFPTLKSFHGNHSRGHLLILDSLETPTANGHQFCTVSLSWGPYGGAAGLKKGKSCVHVRGSVGRKVGPLNHPKDRQRAVQHTWTQCTPNLTVREKEKRVSLRGRGRQQTITQKRAEKSTTEQQASGEKLACQNQGESVVKYGCSEKCEKPGYPYNPGAVCTHGIPRNWCPVVTGYPDTQKLQGPLVHRECGVPRVLLAPSGCQAKRGKATNT